MSLTGWPLLLLTAAATVLAVAGTVRWWRRARMPVRAAAVLLLETLAVLTAGLVVNRQEQFYPSWRALRGDTGTVAVAAPAVAGRLDSLTASSFRWRPAGLPAWRLARPPLVTLPAGYRARPQVAFPVVLSLGAAAPRTASAVTVTVAPTAHTTAFALRTLPGELCHDLRTTPTGWDVIGGGALGDTFVAAGIAHRLPSPADLPPALAAPLRLPTA
jgi:lysyl-tRNA synthetase class 2